MPNWCNNHIQISGSKENMKPIFDFFVKSDKIINEYYKNRVQGESEPDIPVMTTLIPHDEEYERIKKSGEYLLNPQTVFYGTKWDFNFSNANVQDISEDYISLSPSTAWSPPGGFCQKLSEKHNVNVEIFFEEGGNSFVGKEIYDNGELTHSENYDDYLEGLYVLEEEQFWSEVQWRLDDLDDDAADVDSFMEEFEYLREKDKTTLRTDYIDAIEKSRQEE